MQSTARVVKPLGKISELTAKDPDYVQKVKDFYRSQRSTAIATRATIEEVESNSSDFKMPDVVGMPQLNYANYILRSIWTKTLGLKAQLDYLQKRDKIEFDASEMLYQTVINRMTFPESNLSTFDNQHRWLGNSLQKTKIWHMYRMLDFVQKHRDKIMSTAHKNLTKEMGRDMSMVFYDVTNAWFETPYTDLETQEMEIARALRELPEDASAEIIESKIEEVKKSHPILRMRGPSKEHRIDPIVSIAMVIDRQGIPVDFRIYAGNASEKKTMHASIDALGKKYGVKKSIVVADRGLNSFGNLQDLIDNKHGFLVAQSIAGLSSADRDRALNGEDWKWITPDELKVREISFQKVDRSTGEVISTRMIVGWSKSRYDRDKYVIDTNKALAQKAAKDKAEIKSSKYAWLSYVKTEKQKVISLNRYKIEKDEAVAGYFAYVFKDPRELDDTLKAEERMSTEEIVAHYRSLEKIEECFRIMKSNFNLRPFYVRTPEHIEAVVLVCVLALMSLRILSLKLKNDGHEMSTDKIINTLRGANIAAWLQPSGKTLFIPLVSVTTEQRDASNDNRIDLTAPTPLTHIIRALGLTPPIPGCDKNTLGRCLKTRFDTEQEVLGANFYTGKREN